MRVGFAGTPEFAARALAAIVDAGYTIPLCLTQPDRPKGRGLALEPSWVKRLAQGRGVPVAQPASLKPNEVQQALLSVPLDVLVVAAYGLLLPKPVLDWPAHGCLNIHASRLPRWRGAAPIQRAIEAGDTETGITIMRMDAGLDTGPIVDIVDVAIAPRETAGSLADRLAALGATAIVDVLGRLAREHRLDATPQPAEGATYAAKVSAREANVDWSMGAEVIDRRIRAFDPVPGSTTKLGGEQVKLWAASVLRQFTERSPGTIVSTGPHGIDVACGGGTVVRLRSMQPAGGRRMEAGAFTLGRRVVPGMSFSS